MKEDAGLLKKQKKIKKKTMLWIYLVISDRLLVQ